MRFSVFSQDIQCFLLMSCGGFISQSLQSSVCSPPLFFFLDLESFWRLGFGPRFNTVSLKIVTKHQWNCIQPIRKPLPLSNRFEADIFSIVCSFIRKRVLRSFVNVRGVCYFQKLASILYNNSDIISRSSQ